MYHHITPLLLLSYTLELKTYPDQDALVLEVNVCDSDLAAERHGG